jgi:hypothetical protein
MRILPRSRRGTWLLAGAVWCAACAGLWRALPVVVRARVLGGNQCIFSANSRSLFTFDAWLISEYDPWTGRLLFSTDVPHKTGEHFGWLWRLTPRTAIFPDKDGVQLFDFGTRLMTGVSGDAMFTADGRTLVRVVSNPGTDEREIRSVDLASGLDRLCSRVRGSGDIEVSTDGQFAVVSSYLQGKTENHSLQEVRFIDLATGVITGSDLMPGDGWVVRSGFSPNGRAFAATLSANSGRPGCTHTVFAWDLSSGRRFSQTCSGNFSAWGADGTIFVLENDEFIAFNPSTGDQRVVGPAYESAHWIDTQASGEHFFLDRMERVSTFWRTLSDYFPSLRGDYDFVECECYDLAGRRLASVPTTRSGARDLSPDNQTLAVASPSEPGVIDLYDFPPQKSLAWLAAGAALLALPIALITWRRTRKLRAA